MFPAYVYNKYSYPQVRPEMSPNCPLHPPQMKMEAANSPFIYESSPHHYAYPVPTQCHSCCNHNPYPTNYYPYRPPLYPHFPSNYGSYPFYPEPYAFHYPPPQHYSMELPKYEYDKTMPIGFHCCGCSHHMPVVDGDKGVKIVEQESGVENKEDSVVPSSFNNLKLPIVWVPSDEKIKSRVNPEKQELVDHHHKEPGWVPLDVDNLNRLMQNGNSRKDNDDQMPFPLIWVPYNEDKGQISDPEKQKLNAAAESEDQGGGKLSMEKIEKAPRIIAVKQVDESADVKTGNVLKARNTEDDKESSEKGTESKPLSPTRPSRLPPICLRVDPFPKKKNGQGMSRSPSPPGHKYVEAVKPSSSMSENKAENKVKNNIAEVANGDNAEVDKLAKLAVDKKANKPEKKILSGTEAATIIQSAYHGYEVRRWEPLKKMRQIAHIRVEADALKRHIESSAESMTLKEKTVLGETIMNLLLKLDTVQGLHSSIRDIRKSVAKVLVSLQEMLDTIVIKQPDHSSVETRVVETTTQILEESSPIPDLNEVEAEAEASEPVLQEDQDEGVAEVEEKSSNLHELPAHEQQTLEKEREEVTSEKLAYNNEFDVVEEVTIENLDKGRIGSSDQTDMNHNLLDRTLVAAAESEKVNVESEIPISESSMTQESNEISVEQDVEYSAPEEVHVPDNDGEADNLTEAMTVGADSDQAGVVTENLSPLVKPEVVHEEDANPVEEDVKLVVCSTGSYVKEDFRERRVTEENEKMRSLLEKMMASGKEQQEVICRLNEKLKELESKLAKQKKEKKRGVRARKARIPKPRSSKEAPKVLAS